MSQVTSAQPIVSAQEQRNFAATLRTQTLACRVRFEKFGVRKALTRQQLSQVGETFDADSKQLSASKKLIDTRDPAYRALVSVRARIGHLWKSNTTPYPEPGIRLIKRAAVETFNTRMVELEAELQAAARKLQEVYEPLRERAKEKLGDLFNATDYPQRIDTEYGVHWDFPAIEPPAYLKNLHPELYEQECRKIEGRFQEAVALAEQAFVQQFHQLVAHLAERLSGDADGKPKVFRDSAIANLNEFFEQFKQLDIGSSGQLQQLVSQAQAAIGGHTPEDLRADASVRASVGAALSQIQQQVDSMMVDKPERRINLEDE